MKRMVTVVGRNRSHGTNKMLIPYINERNKDIYEKHDWQNRENDKLKLFRSTSAKSYLKQKKTKKQVYN